MKIGYGRVSTLDQNLDLQSDALKAAGCDRVYLEKHTGAKMNRPELTKLLDHLRPGDTVVVWKLDRLGRSLIDMLELTARLEKNGNNLIILTEAIDTTTPTGKLIFQIFAAIAEAERNRIIERTNAGLASARARGRIGGRPKGLTKKNQDKAEVVANLYKAGNSISKIRELTSIGSSKTIYNYLRHMNVPITEAEKAAVASKERPALELDGNYKQGK